MPETERPRVMIVEDFVLIQENIRLVLARECDVVGTAEDGEAALAAAAGLAPDIITIDLSLPGMSGFALAENLKQELPATKLLFVTAHGEKAYIQRAFEIGAKGYLLKDAIHTELLGAIREISAGRRYLSRRLRGTVKLNQSYFTFGGSQPQF